jgi:cyanophycinase-like exopeptidase
VARLLVIMGSGETSPTMVKTHRDVFARLEASAAGSALLLDTPFGFQENADQISARAVEYFRESVGTTVEVASFRRAEGADPLAREAALAKIDRASWVFAGPGSPTYALRQWSGSEIPKLLADKLRHGGCVNFASAAALTLGVATVPVYEIYKVGDDPSWVEGLDLLSEFGLRAAVIPHYDNAEGGSHDTRYCYLGERRLRMMEEQLPDDVFVLGVDEHTAVVLDLEAETAAVVGMGDMTMRRHGQSTAVPTGSTMPLNALPDLRMGKGAAFTAAAAPAGTAPPHQKEATPLLATIRETQEAFDAALARRDVDSAIRAVLELDDALVAWSRDTLQSDEQDRGRAAVRRMIVALGDLAKLGARDPNETLGPYVEALLAERIEARAGRRFGDADRIRDRLTGLGLEVRDTPDGTEWRLPGAGR